jgi:hypothetical protein
VNLRFCNIVRKPPDKIATKHWPVPDDHRMINTPLTNCTGNFN